jgi:hypothetical protein
MAGDREDGDVGMLAAWGALLLAVLGKNFRLADATPYRVVDGLLRRGAPPRIATIQLGRERYEDVRPALPVSVIIPHHGSMDDLRRCLATTTEVIGHEQSEIMVGLDAGNDLGAPRGVRCRVLRVNGQRVGPYAIRNHLSGRATHSPLVFQDSDDIPMANRFAVLARHLAIGGADLVGTHELRFDSMARRLRVVRFPLDVTAALRKGACHAQLHPTSAISADAFRRLRGFSDYAVHSLDTEFLLRAHVLKARIANLDRFLYLRIVRPGSLTTSASTGYESNVRRQLRDGWYRDFDVVARGQKPLASSALALRRADSARFEDLGTIEG